jgi:hypothetical protein
VGSLVSMLDGGSRRKNICRIWSIFIDPSEDDLGDSLPQDHILTTPSF